MTEKTGARLRAIRARRDEIAGELAGNRARLAEMKVAGEGGPERRMLKASVKTLRAERAELKSEATQLKGS